MRHIIWNERLRARSVAASIALVLLVATGCSNVTTPSVTDSGDGTLVTAQPVAADKDRDLPVPTTVATPAVTSTPDAPLPVSDSDIERVPVDPTSVPALPATPRTDKNQPVYRQARIDGDSRTSPVLINLDTAGGVREIGEELSAFTDRTDAFRIGVANTIQEIVVQWSCTTYQSEDGRPLRLTVERGGAVLSEFRCVEVGVSGSTRVDMVDGPVDIVADIEAAPGAGLTNMFVEYTLTVRSLEAGAGDDDATENDPDDEADDPTSSQATEPTATVVPGTTPTPTFVPIATPEPSATAGPSTTPEPSPTAETPSATPTPTPSPEPTLAPTYVDTPSSRTAPEDGDSRTNPAQIEDDGFLFGSVSSPRGDNADWSTFVVGPEDPTELFAGVRCDEFESQDGSGVFTLRVIADEVVAAELVCTSDIREDFTLLDFTQGTRYLVQAEFTGSGYTNWSFEVQDDD